MSNDWNIDFSLIDKRIVDADQDFQEILDEMSDNLGRSKRFKHIRDNVHAYRNKSNGMRLHVNLDETRRKCTIIEYFSHKRHETRLRGDVYRATSELFDQRAQEEEKKIQVTKKARRNASTEDNAKEAQTQLKQAEDKEKKEQRQKRSFYKSLSSSSSSAERYNLGSGRGKMELDEDNGINEQLETGDQEESNSAEDFM